MWDIKGTILELIFTADLWLCKYVKDCNCWIATPQDKNLHDYWIISHDFDLNRQAELFEKVKNFVDDPSFLKNISLIYVKKVDKINLLSIDESIINIENDPYFFKKYVLAYTEESYNKLYDLLTTKYDGILLANIMREPESYKKLQDEDSFGPYHLLYSIAHKIPFITLEIKPKDYDAIANFHINNDDDKILAEIETVPQVNADTYMKKLIENTDDDEDIKA